MARVPPSPPPAPSLQQQRAVRERCRHPRGAFTPFGPEDLSRSVPARFEGQARRHAGRVALAAHGRSLTYAELNRAANRVARALATRADAADRPTALLFGQGAAAIVAMLGVLKAGRFYVFLDPTLPSARLALLLAEAQASAVITDAAGLDLARRLMPPHDVLDAGAADGDGQDLGLPIGPDRLFYVMFTSGSTGRPKGVVHDHRNILDTIAKYTLNMHICPEDRVPQIAGGSFNTSVLSIFGTLLNGAALLPFDLKVEGAARLATWLREERITLFHAVPTAYRQLLDAMTDSTPYPALRAVCLGGEAVYRRDVERHRGRFGPDVPLVHGLGSTELSMVRQYFVDGGTPLGESRVPVGYPIEDREVLLLDPEGRPVPAGEAGEIVLRSRYLARGYWRRPDLTREAFTSDPTDPSMRRYRTGDLGVVTPDGCLTHLGRQDFQVKIRGHRVESAEVELALLELPGIREAVVTAGVGRAGEQELIAYVVPAGEPPTPGALRIQLAARLPDYMLPAAFVALPDLPLTDTGKVDVRALPAPGRGRSLPGPAAAPATPMQEALAAIWREVLDLDEVGVHDDFLALGGNSLLATQILARVQRAFGTSLPPSALLGAGTVTEMAGLLGDAGPLAADSA